MKDITKMVGQSQLLRAAVNRWKEELPEASLKAVDALNEVRGHTADLLQAKAQEWKGENKLLHAGAALALAKELKEKMGDRK